jgi:hypothetical protein
MADGKGSQMPINSRHPELVSGPIARFALLERGKAKPHCQIDPTQVVFVDQVDLPLPVPALQLFFAQDGRLHFTEQLEVDQGVDVIERSETRHCIAAMLGKAENEVRRDANIDCAIRPACENIDARLAFMSHPSEFVAQWALKQVQGDGIFEVVF